MKWILFFLLAGLNIFAKSPDPSAPLILLDPGHGGYNVGARVKNPYCEEKMLALQTAYITKKYLEEKGYRVSLTRARDYFLPLQRRVFIANHGKANIFVSIHFNSCPSQNVEGIEIFYYPSKKNWKRTGQSKKLASLVLSKTISETKASSRGVKEGNFFVIRETKIPAILIEGGFLTHPQERKRLKQRAHLEKIAKGIAKGVDRYFHS